MSEQPSQPRGPAPQPTGNTESDAAGQLGEQVGRFAVLAVRRLEQMASAGAAMAAQTTARQMTTAREGMAAQAMAAQTPPARRTAEHGEADERDVSETGSRAPDEPAPDEPAPDSATARAEALVDTAGAQLGTLATLVTHQLRRAAALAREEAEDIWAEAQQIRAARHRDPDEGQGRSIS